MGSFLESVLFDLCLFLCQYWAVLVIIALLYILRCVMIPPALFLWIKIALAFRGFLYLHMNFRIFFFSVVRDGDCVDL